MVELSHLSFTYEAYGGHPNTPVLRDVDISVKQGEKLLILGAPDSGKSTLARIICNLVPRFAAGTLSGAVLLDGLQSTGLFPWDLTDRCTMVAQNPQEQLLMTTCGDEVAFPLESLGIRREELVGRVHQALHHWGLDEMIDVNPQELSGGERKRLLLAVADAIDAPIWVMDEPFDDLDEKWRSHLLKEIEKGPRTTILFGSRYLEEFRGSFDSYALLKDGMLTTGTEEEIVLAFDQECDSRFSQTIGEVSVPSSHALVASEMTIVHARRSVSSDSPFTLRVPRFELASGEVVALVGPNGSGKSTFSRVLCGLDPFESGRVEMDGKAREAKQLNGKVGYLFQNPDFGIFLPTVRDELGWSLRHMRSVPPERRESLVRSCAQSFHLDLDDNPTMMSYGARKHLQAAVYHLLDRPFIIIDELDSGVTYAAAFEIVSLLRMRGAGVLLITHDKMFARNLAQRQYAIVEGTVVETEVGA